MPRPQGSPNIHTPFIPPLPSPAGRSPVQPPVIPPSPRENREPMPAWGNQPQTPAHYPVYPQSPYTGPGFIPPNLGAQTPAANTLPIPGSYFPPPTHLPPTAPQHHPGYSHDFTGFPGGGAGAAWSPHPSHPGTPYVPPGGGFPGTPWTGAAPMPQGTPWAAPNSAPPGTPWHGPPGTPWQQPAYPSFQPPPSASMYPPMGMPGMPGMYPPAPPPPAWGPPPAADPWAAQQPQAPGWGGGGGASSQARAPTDVVDRFAVGDNYGPVLEPFLAKVVGAQLMVNPLLSPMDLDHADQQYLKWNMLFNSGYCQRSDDRAHVSWTKGRDAPATFPRLTQLRLVSKSFPWMISIHARNATSGVTCGEVIDNIDDYMHRFSSKEDFKSQPRPMQKKVTEAYHHNRAAGPGVPGGVLGEGMLRCDWICQETMFGGVCRNDNFVKEKCGDVLPATFELRCIHRYPMTEQEIKDEQLRTREQERAQRRQSQRSRSANRDSVRSSVRIEEPTDEESSD